METNHYDVVVCGAELAGAVAAALLARRGLRVLLCGLESAPRTFNAAGFALPREPGLLPPLDAEPVARVLRELNQVQVVRRRAPVASPPLQIAVGEQRLDLGADAATLARELRREFPGEAATIEAGLERLASVSAALDPLLGSDLTLPPDGFWERREVARVEAQLPAANADLLAPLPADHPVRAALAALAALSGGFAPSDVGAVVHARAVDSARRGAFRLEGHGPALRALLLEKLSTSSGEVRERLAPVELLLRRGRVVGFRAGPRGELIGFDHLVWAGPVAALLGLCGDKASRRLREIAGALRPACYRYSLCLLVRPEGLPEGMGPRLVAVRDPTQPLLEDNALSINLGAPSPREPDRVPVWVECLIPAAAATSGSGYLAVVRARVREQLGRLMPFFDRHLLVLASPHDGLPPELPDGDPRGGTDPVPATPMPAALASDLPRVLGVAAAPHATGMRNLWLAGAENLPGLGREGEFISAWGITRLIAGPQARARARREILIQDA